MIIVPPDLLTRFESILTKRSVPIQLHNYYQKWLRFYLDFCHKYIHPNETEESLRWFIKKLQEKNQTPEQQKQAADAISLYFTLLKEETVPKVSINPSTPLSANPDLPAVSGRQLIWEASAKRLPPQRMPQGVDGKGVSTSALIEWEKTHADLCAEIKIRHYSPKTLKSYALWAKKFQVFTRNRDLQSLSPTDVKEFMKYLAVTQKVSASTQDQGFNVLLFLFRHILKKDFGE